MFGTCLNTYFQFLNNIIRIFTLFHPYIFKKTENCCLNIHIKQALKIRKQHFSLSVDMIRTTSLIHQFIINTTFIHQSQHVMSIVKKIVKNVVALDLWRNKICLTKVLFDNLWSLNIKTDYCDFLSLFHYFHKTKIQGYWVQLEFKELGGGKSLKWT